MKLLNSLKSKIFGKEDTKRNIVFFTMILGVFFFNFALFLSVHGGDIKNGFKNLTSLFAATSTTSDDNKNVAGAMVDDFYITSNVDCDSDEDEFNFGKDAGNITSGSCVVWTTSPESSITFNSAKAKENKTVWKAITDFFNGIQIAGASDKSISDKVSYSLSAGTMRVFEVFGWTSEWTPMNYFETFFTTSNGISNSAITETSSRWNFSGSSTNEVLYRLYEYVPNWVPDGTPIEYVLKGTTLNSNVNYDSTIKAYVDGYVYNRYYQVQPYVTFEKSGNFIFSSIPVNEFNSIAANYNGQNFYKQNGNSARSIYQLMKEDQDFFDFESGGGPNLLRDYYGGYTYTQGSDGKWTTNYSGLTGQKFDTAGDARTAVIEKVHPGATRSFSKNGYVYIYCAGDDDHKLPHFKQYKPETNGTHIWWEWDGVTNKGNGFDYGYDSRGELFVALTTQQADYVKEQRKYMEQVKENYSTYSIGTTHWGGSVALEGANANVGTNGSALTNTSTDYYVWEDWYKYNIQYDIYKATFYNNYQISTTQFSADAPANSNTQFLYVKTSNVALFSMTFNRAQYGTTTFSTQLSAPGYDKKISGTNVLQSTKYDSIPLIRKYTSYLYWNDTTYAANQNGFNILAYSKNVTNQGLFKSNTPYYKGQTVFSLSDNTNYYVFDITIPWITRGVGASNGLTFSTPTGYGSQFNRWGLRTQNTSDTLDVYTIDPESASIAIANVFTINSGKMSQAMIAFATQKGYPTCVYTDGGTCIEKNGYYLFKNSNGDHIYLQYNQSYLTEVTFTVHIGEWKTSSDSTTYCLKKYPNGENAGKFYFSNDYTSSDCYGRNSNTTVSSSTDYFVDGEWVQHLSISDSSTIRLEADSGTDTLTSYYGKTTYYGIKYYKPKWTNFASSTSVSTYWTAINTNQSYTGLSASSSNSFYTSASKGSFIYFPGSMYNFKSGDTYYTLIGFRNTENSGYYYRYITSTGAFISRVTINNTYKARYKATLCNAIYKVVLWKYRNGNWNAYPSYQTSTTIYCRADSFIDQVKSKSATGDYIYSLYYATEAEIKANLVAGSSYYTTTSFSHTQSDVAWSKNQSHNGAMGIGAWNNGITGEKWFIYSVSQSSYWYVQSDDYYNKIQSTRAYSGINSDYYTYQTGYRTFSSDWGSSTVGTNSGSYISAYYNSTSYQDTAQVMYMQSTDGQVIGGKSDGWIGGGWGNANDTYMRYKNGYMYNVENYARTIFRNYTSYTRANTSNMGGSYCILNYTGTYNQSFDYYTKWASNVYLLRQVTFYASGGSFSGVCPSSGLYTTDNGDVTNAFTPTVRSVYTNSYTPGNYVTSTWNATAAQNTYHYGGTSYGVTSGQIVKFYYASKSQYGYQANSNNNVQITAQFYGNDFIGITNVANYSASSSSSLFDSATLKNIASSIFNTTRVGKDGTTYETIDGSYKESYLAYLVSKNKAWSDMTNVKCYVKYDTNARWFDAHSNEGYYEIPGLKSIFNFTSSNALLGRTSSAIQYSYLDNRKKLATLSSKTGKEYSYLTVTAVGSKNQSSQSVYKISSFKATYVMDYNVNAQYSGDSVFQTAQNFKAISDTVAPTFVSPVVSSSDSIGGKDFARIVLLTSLNTESGKYKFGSVVGNYQSLTRNTTIGESTDNYYSFKKVELGSSLDAANIKNSHFSSPGTNQFIVRADGHWVLQDLKMRVATKQTDTGVNLTNATLESEGWYSYDGSRINITAPSGYTYGESITGITSEQDTKLYITGETAPEGGKQYYYRNSPNSSDKISVYGIKTTPVVLGAQVTKYFYGNPSSSYFVNYVNGIVSSSKNDVLNGTFYVYNELNEIPNGDENDYPTFAASNSNLGKSVTYGNNVTYGSTTYSAVYANRNSDNTAFTRDSIKICTRDELINSANSGSIDCLLESSNSISQTTNVAYSINSNVIYLYAKYNLPNSVFKAWVPYSTKNISYDNSSFNSTDADAVIASYVSGMNGEIHIKEYVDNKDYNYTTSPSFAFVLNKDNSTKQRYYTLITKGSSTVWTDSWYKNGDLRSTWDSSIEDYTIWYNGGARSSLTSNNLFNLDGWISELLLENGKTYLNVGNNTIRQTPDIYIETINNSKYRISFTKANASISKNVGTTSGKTYTLSINATVSGTITVTLGNVSKTISTSSNVRTDVTYTATSSTTTISIKGSANARIDINWTTLVEGSSFTYYAPYGATLSYNNSINYREIGVTGEKYRRYDGHDVNIRMLYVAADGQLVKTPTEVYDIYYSANNKRSYDFTDKVNGEMISSDSLETKLANSTYARALLTAILNNASDNFVALDGVVSPSGKEFEFSVDGVLYSLVPVTTDGTPDGTPVIEYAMEEYALGAYLEIIGYGSDNYYYFNANERTSNPPDDYSFSFKNPVTNTVSQLNFSDLILYSDALIGGKTYLNDPNYNYKSIISYKDGHLYIADASLSDNRMTDIHGYYGVLLNGSAQNSVASVLKQTTRYLSIDDISEYRRVQGYVDANYKNGNFYSFDNCWKDVTNYAGSFSNNFGTIKTTTDTIVNYSADWKIVGYAQLASEIYGYEIVDGSTSGESITQPALEDSVIVFSYDGTTLKIKNLINSNTLIQFTFQDNAYYYDGSNYVKLNIDNIRSSNVHDIYQKDGSGYIHIAKNLNTSTYKTYILSNTATNLYGSKTLEQKITINGVETVFSMPDRKYSLRGNGFIYSSEGSFESNKGFWESNEDTLFYSEKDENKYGNSWKHNSQNHDMKANSIFIETTECYYLVMPNEGIRSYKKDMSDYGTANVEGVNFFKVGSSKYNQIMNSSSFKYGLTANSNAIYRHDNANQFLYGMGQSTLIYNIESGDNSIFKNGYGYAISDQSLKLYYVVYKLDTLGPDGKDWRAMYYWGTNDALQGQWLEEIALDSNAKFFYDENDELYPNSFLYGSISYESLELEWRSSYFDENGEKVDLYENYIYLKGYDGNVILDNNGDAMKLEVNVLFKASKNVLYKYNLVSSQSNYSIANVMNYYAEDDFSNNGAGFYTTTFEGDIKKSVAVSITDASGIEAGASYNEDFFHMGCGQYGARMFSGIASAIALTPKNTVLIVSNSIFNKIRGANRKYVRISSDIKSIFGDIYIEEEGGNRIVKRYDSKFQAGLYEYYLISSLYKSDGKTKWSSDSWNGLSSPSKAKEEIPEYILVNNGTSQFTYTSRRVPLAANAISVYYGETSGSASSNPNVTEFSYSVAYLYAFFLNDEPSNPKFYTDRITYLFYRVKAMYEALEPAKNKISFDDFLLRLDSEYSKNSKVKNEAKEDTWLLTAEGIMQVLNSSYISWEYSETNYSIDISYHFAEQELWFLSNDSLSLGTLLSGDARKIQTGDYSIKREKTDTGYKFIIYANARMNQSQSTLISQAIEDSKNTYQENNPIATLYLVKKNNLSYVYIELQDTDFIQSDGSMFDNSDMVQREGSSVTTDFTKYTSFFENSSSFKYSSMASDYAKYRPGDSGSAEHYKGLLLEENSKNTGILWWSDSKLENATQGPISRIICTNDNTEGYWYYNITHALNESLPIVSSREKHNRTRHYLYDNLLYNGDYAVEIQLFGTYYNGGNFHNGYYFPYAGTNPTSNSWKNYWFYRSSLVYMTPQIFIKGTDGWDTKYTPLNQGSSTLEQRSIKVVHATNIYPTSMISIIGRNRVNAMVRFESGYGWYYSSFGGLARMLICKIPGNATSYPASLEIGKDKDTVYALFAFDPNSVTLSFSGNMSNSGASTIQKFTGTLTDSKITFDVSGEYTNDTNGLAANEMNPGTNLYFKVTINDVSYQGSHGTNVSEYEQSKEFLIKVVRVRDENNNLRDLTRDDEANFNRWGYIFLKENGRYVAYYVGQLSVKQKGDSSSKSLVISNYSFKDIRNDGATGELWFTADNSLYEIQMNNLVGAAEYIIKVRERFANGSTSKLGVYTLVTGDDKVNNPWGKTLQKVENGKYKNEPWAQTLIDSHVRNAFFKYSRAYSDKLFLMTGGIIKTNGYYYYLNGISGEYKNLSNNSLLNMTDADSFRNYDLTKILNGQLVSNDANFTYYGNADSVCLIKGEKTAKFLENSYEKGLHIPDKFRYRFYNDGQKPVVAILNVEEGGWTAAAGTKLVFEKGYNSSEKMTVDYVSAGARSGFPVELYGSQANSIGLTQKYIDYVNHFGKVVTVDDIDINNGGKFDVLNDVLLDSKSWNVYITGGDVAEHMDKKLKFTAKYDVSASYECLYLDLSCALDNDKYVNNIIEDYEFRYIVDNETKEYLDSGFFAKNGEGRYGVGDLGKLLGIGYDVDLGNSPMTYQNEDPSEFSDILGNQVLNGVWANENSTAVILSKDKAATASEINISKIYSKRDRIIVPYNAPNNGGVLLYLCEIDENGKVIGILNS